MIDILVPVLGRPQNVRPLVDSIVRSTTVDHRIVFICTAGDDAQITEANVTPEIDLVLVMQEPSGSGDYARKINRAARHLDGDLIFNGADDIEFTPRWAEAAMRMMRGPVRVVATNDKANRQVMRGEFGTHCLISREYIDEEGGTADNTPGLVFHEGYDHNFVDRELCAVARARRRYAYARTSVVKHHHPLWRTAPWDPTYRKALARFRQDQQLFMERSALWTTTHNRDIVRG